MEMVELRDTDGSTTGEVKERREVHRDGDLYGTSHVWLVRCQKEGRGAEVLLQKRSAGKDSFPGCYDISSAGHIPAGADFEESALRELEEELGITAEPKDLHYLFTHIGYREAEFYGQIFKNHEYSRVYLYECDREPEDFHLQKEEVESVRWIECRECLERIRKDEIEHCIFLDEFEELVPQIEAYFADAGRPSTEEKALEEKAPGGGGLAKTWAEDAQNELEDWIEEQGIYIRQ